MCQIPSARKGIENMHKNKGREWDGMGQRGLENILKKRGIQEGSAVPGMSKAASRGNQRMPNASEEENRSRGEGRWDENTECKRVDGGTHQQIRGKKWGGEVKPWLIPPWIDARFDVPDYAHSREEEGIWEWDANIKRTGGGANPPRSGWWGSPRHHTWKWNNMKMEHEDEKEKGEKERKGCLRATECRRRGDDRVRREKYAQGALSMPAPWRR
ncbi:hypothetical protein C8J57DRAFT_1239668 [Mycena rebaudengoi]|nr:hypothetical protein C8J57DRAFT_1239668 [Mycena rebaudengoi]